MSCCGKKRASFPAGPPGLPAPFTVRQTARSPESAGEPGNSRSSSIFFEYTGKTGMTVWGAISGKRYRFEKPGSRVMIDPRDRPSLAQVPNLKQTWPVNYSSTGH
ncbi:MAG TPA: hypothetical protein PLD52_06790 [Bacteroidales bacterium]|nr:hypothetical protein [Bacteroidales bacterium]